MVDISYAPVRRRTAWERVWHYLRWVFLAALILVGVKLCSVAWSHWYAAHLFYAAAASVIPGSSEPLYDDDPTTASVLLKSPDYELARWLNAYPGAVTRKNPAWDKCWRHPPARFFIPGECLLVAGEVIDDRGQRYLLFITCSRPIGLRVCFSDFLSPEPLLTARYLPEIGSEGLPRLVWSANGDPGATTPVRLFAGEVVGNSIRIPYIRAGTKGLLVITWDPKSRNIEIPGDWDP